MTRTHQILVGSEVYKQKEILYLSISPAKGNEMKLIDFLKTTITSPIGTIYTKRRPLAESRNDKFWANKRQ